MKSACVFFGKTRVSLEAFEVQNTDKNFEMYAFFIFVLHY